MFLKFSVLCTDGWSKGVGRTEVEPNMNKHVTAYSSSVCGVFLWCGCVLCVSVVLFVSVWCKCVVHVCCVLCACMVCVVRVVYIVCVAWCM